jgi:hypothetical protein
LLSVEHIAAVRSLQTARGSAPPAAIRVQVPSAPATAQLRQAPAQAVAQQTPSTQFPSTQSAAAVQDCPSTFWPQVPIVCPTGMVQACPAAQSAAVVQDSLQAPLWQAKFPHLKLCGGRQVPRPSQVRAEFPEVASTHAAGPHGLLAGYELQPPLPSQIPVVPQVAGSCLRQSGCPWPEGVGVQVPTKPTWSQAWQAPAQALSQQNPLAQWLEPHSASAPQATPRAFGPQLPPRQCSPETQSVSAVQVPRH